MNGIIGTRTFGLIDVNSLLNVGSVTLVLYLILMLIFKQVTNITGWLYVLKNPIISMVGNDSIVK